MVLKTHTTPILHLLPTSKLLHLCMQLPIRVYSPVMPYVILTNTMQEKIIDKKKPIAQRTEKITERLTILSE